MIKLNDVRFTYLDELDNEKQVTINELSIIRKDVLFVNNTNQYLIHSLIDVLLLNTKFTGEYSFNKEKQDEVVLKYKSLKKEISFTLNSKLCLIEDYTVYNNVVLPLIFNGAKTKTAKNKVIEILEGLKFFDSVNKKVLELTEFEKVKCVIAMAIASNKNVFIFDSLFNKLTTEEADIIIKLIEKYLSTRAVIIINDDLEKYSKIANKKINIENSIVSEEILIKTKNKAETIAVIEKTKQKSLYGFELLLKNIFTKFFKNMYFVLLYFSLLSLLVIMFLSNNLVYSSKIHTSDLYNNLINNRIIIENSNYNTINPSRIANKLKTDNVVNNSFFEDHYLDIKFENSEGDYQALLLTYVNFKAVNVVGAQPRTDEQLVLGLSKNFIRNNKFDILNERLTLNEKEYDVVGYYISNCYTDDIFITSITSQNDKIKEEIFKQMLNDKPLERSINSLSLDNIDNDNKYVLIKDSLTINEIVFTYKSEGYETIKSSELINVILYNKYVFSLKDYKVTFKTTTLDEEDGQLSFSTKTYLNILSKNSFQTTVYQNDTKEAMSLINDLGYRSTLVIDTLNISSDLRMAYIVLTIVIFLVCISLYFVGYYFLNKLLHDKLENCYFKIQKAGYKKRKIVSVIVVEQLFYALVAFVIVFVILTLGYTFNIGQFFIIYERSILLYNIIFIASLVILTCYVGVRQKDKLILNDL